MPRQIRKVIFYTSIFIGLLSAFSIALYMYGSQAHCLRKFTVAGWRVGGMPYDTFRATIRGERLQLLSAFPIQLHTSYPNIRQSTIGPWTTRRSISKGNSHSITCAAIRKPLRSDGSKLAGRFVSADIPLEVTVNNAQLNSAVKEAWKDLYSQQPVAAKRIVTNAGSLNLSNPNAKC